MNRRTFNKTALVSVLGSGLGALVYSRPESPKSDVSKKPNFLFCIADDMSYPHMSAYGCKWVNTPGFDKIAQDGLLFTRGYVPNAKCAPSRACILTGRNSWQLEEAANHAPFFPIKFKVFTEVLAEQGYFVGHTTKVWGPGRIGHDKEGNQRQLGGVGYQDRKQSPPTSAIGSTDYAGNFSAFLDDRKPGQPFFFWYGAREPHRPYEYKSGIQKGNKSVSDVDRVYDFWPDNDVVRTDMLDYAYACEWFDSHLEKMLSLLGEKGELENTIVVVTSDHGMPFPRIKGQAYEPSNHVPLAIMWPNGITNPGRTVDDFVSLIDLAPTILELAQIPQDISGMQSITGKSITNIFYSSKAGLVDQCRDHVLLGQERHDVGRPNDEGYPIRGIVKGDYLFLRNFEPDRWPSGNPETGYLNCDGSPTKTVVLDTWDDPETKKYWKWCFGMRPSEELYNIQKDPDCINNLAYEQDYQHLKQDLRSQLFAELIAQKDPRMFGRGYIFDQYKHSRPQVRDYYNRLMAGEDVWRPVGWVNASDYRPYHALIK